MDAQQQDLIAQFCGVTGASAAEAQNALLSSNYNLQEAVSLYFASQEADDSENEEAEEESQPAPQPSQSSASTSSRQAPTQRKKQMTIDDLKKREEDGEDSDDDDHKKQNLYAGGEKSALAVQNPGQSGGPTDHFKNIMNQARQNRERPENNNGEEASSGPSRSANFAGRAQTLGGDDAPSEVVEDPTAVQTQRQQAATRVTRTLHLWADGISIDDGPLFRFDDPANQAMMAEINQGRAPLALLDVQAGQEVDLNLDPHKDENYVQPKKQYKPFGGSGQRLGAPTPGPASTTTTAAQPAASAAPSTPSPPPPQRSTTPSQPFSFASTSATARASTRASTQPTPSVTSTLS